MQNCKAFFFSHNGVNTRIRVIAEGILRITRTRREDFLPGESDTVVLHTDVQGKSEAFGAYTALSAGNLAVRVDQNTHAMTFLDQAGHILLREPDVRPCILQEKPVFLHRYDPQGEIREERSVDGIRAYAVPAETWQDRTAYECRQQFVFDGEALYGLGSHEEGFGNLRGKHRQLYQHNMKAVVPVLVSTKGWGILFDMGCQMAFHDDAEGSYLWAECADELDWYFFYGDGSYATLMQQYRRLTGETPMLPKAALGYIQSKERYVDAQEMLAVAREYRRRRIPIDMLVLDWQSWPEGQWGCKTFDTKRFPNPTEFIDQLHRMDLKFMISIWPSMQGERNADREEMLEKGFMLGNRINYNAFDPQARRLYWEQASRGLFAHGVDAWWCDCSEPFESDWRGAIRPEPAVRAAVNTEEAKRYLDPARISLYSLFHSQGIYEGQRSEREDKRVCNLTRSSWAGQHRSGTITWSGDVSATWETLRRHIPEGLNFCATGEAFWSTDIGAFFPNRNDLWFIDGDYDKGVDDLGYRELYVRWAQYAAFLPMMRSHGTVTPREIWRFGEEGEPFYDAIAAAIRLRYRLVPYLYSLMAQTYTDGLPMLRVPALVFPQDAHLQEIDDQMMLGDVLLIKPVTRPMYDCSGSEAISSVDDLVSVYLPDGCRWYDLYTGEAFDGGQTLTVHAPLDRIPAFVRAGAILPWGAPVQSTGELTNEPLTLRIYPGADGDFLLYDDAGDGYGYEQGEYAAIPLHWDDAARTLTIGRCQAGGCAMPPSLQIDALGLGEKEITYVGDEIKVITAR